MKFKNSGRVLQQAALGSLILFAMSASAALQLKLSDGTVAGTVVITDEGPGDAFPGEGIIQYIGPVGDKWVVDVSTGVSKPVLGSPASAHLDLGSSHVSDEANAHLTVELTDTDFFGAGTAVANFSGTTDGVLSWKTFVDAANAPFGHGTLVTSQGPFGPPGFFDLASNNVALAGPYSVSYEVTIDHASPGRSSFNADFSISPPTCDCVLSITCPPDATLQCGSGTGTNVTGVATVTSSGNCNALLTYSDSTAPGNCAANYVITRTWTATPQTCGQAVSCTQTITVQDTNGPTLTVPADVTVECSAIPPEGTATATDNCDSSPVVTYLGETRTGTPCDYLLVRTWKATDACGNTTTKSQNITVHDTTAPVLIVPPDTAVECTAVPPLGSATALDNCDTNPVVAFVGESRIDGNCAGNYTLVRTWTATDVCGNATTNRQTITVRDTTAPTISCSANKTVECGSQWDFDAPSASDACSGATVSVLNTVTNGTACNQTITRTWRATDGCGNFADCSQTVTVRDTTPPVINCPTNSVMTNSQGTLFCGYTPGGWGAPPNGGNPGQILKDNFATVYPGGFVEVGIPGNSGYSAKFTSAAAIEAYLPDGGTPGALTGDLVNPTSTPAAVFGQHVLALRLNVDFSAAGIIGGSGGSLGVLVLNDSGSPLNGMTVNQILAAANTALGGGALPAGMSISQLNDLLNNFNNAFDNCSANGWAVAHLLPGGGTQDPGTATATDNCDAHPVITFADSTITEQCSSIVIRTWTATDKCGNSATCVQRLTLAKPSVCVPNTFSFSTGSGSALDGPDGNVRVFTTNGVSVKATAFSRIKSSGAWSTAWLGQYSGGLGVTDSSEGDGSNNAHTTDNIDRDNFVLFEFSEPVTIKRAFLGYVVTDSDLTLWIGNFADPYNNHLALSDSVLSSFSHTEENLTDLTTTRWADLNSGEVVGNAIVIAALVSDTSPEDQFKISMLDICRRVCTPLKLECVGASGKVGTAYSSALAASGGVAPYTFSVISGSLPPGLTLNPATGAITGTPTTAGSFSFTAKVTDSQGNSAFSVCTAGCSAGPCNTTFDFSTPTGCLGVSQSYTAGGMTIVAYGYNVSGSPVAANLYGKTGGGNENGLGMCAEIDHEIDKNYAIVLDLGDVIAKGAQNAQIRIGSAQPGEPYNIYGSTDGVTWTLILSDGTLDYTYFALPAFPTYRYIAVTADGTQNAAANVLIGALTVNCAGPCSITIAPPACNGSICGSVLRDCDADGYLTGEQGLAGWTVTLKNSGGTVLATATTDANGNYCFNNLTAATYIVVVTPKPSYSVTSPSGCNHQQTVSVGSCQNKTGINFGYTGTAPAVNIVMTGPASAKCGDTITYTFYVTNTGNTCVYGGLTVNDTLLGGQIFHQTPVAPGEGFVFTKTYVVKTSDPNPLVNTATAVGDPPGSLANVSKQVSVSTAISCSTVPGPTCLTATPGCSQVSLSWSALSGASSYRVKRSTVKGGPYTTIKTGLGSTSYTDTSVVNGTVYYYVVTAIKSGSETDNSNEESAIPTAGLPSPWNTKDVGSVGDSGGASYTSGKFTVVGSGADIWNTADEFRYVYQTASGDCSVVARVSSIGNTDPWAKAGVMIRETTATGSKHASVFITPGNGVAFQSRNATGGSSVNANTTGPAAPYWVKIVRSGNTFTAYYSATGSSGSWVSLGSQSITMSSSVTIGLAVTSHNDGVLCSAIIDNVTATP